MSYGKVNKQYISSINFLDQREILNDLLDVTNEESTFLDIMELCGRAEVTAQPDFHQFENEELYGIGEVASVTSGSGSAQVVFDLTPATKDACRPGNLVMFNDKLVGYVYDKDDDELTVNSVDGSNLTVAGTDKLSFFSNASGEGAGGPAPFRKGQVKNWNQVHSFDGAYEITDIQGASKVETKYKGSHYVIYKGQHEAFKKFQGDMGFGLFISRISDANFQSANPTLVDKNGNPVQTTRGVNQYVEDYGINQSLNTSSTIGLVDFKAFEKTANKKRAPREYIIYTGGNKNIEFDEFLNGLGSTPDLKNARFSVDGRNLDLGMDSFRLFSRTYHKKYLSALDHQNVINFDGSAGFQDEAFFIPEGKMKTADGKSLDYCRLRYMMPFGKDSRYFEVNTGAYAPGGSTNDEKKWKITYYATMGVECLGANFFAKWDNG